MRWTVSKNTFIIMGLSEYAVFSLSLALVIVRFFPVVHKRIVSKVTTVEHQSLYWGFFTVCNLCAGRFMTMRVTVISTSISPLSAMHTAIGVDGCVCVILLLGAIISSLKNQRGKDVPFPKEVFCCKPKMRRKRVLVNFTFMIFVYYTVMDAISISLLMFLEEYRSNVVSFSFLYISLLIFLTLVFSYSNLIRFTKFSSCTRFTTYCGTCFVLTSVFAAVLLVMFMYMIIMFSLSLQGLTGLITGLIPSVALSAASWYIKNKLLSKAFDPPGAVHGGGEDNERGGGDSDNGEQQRMLLP